MGWLILFVSSASLSDALGALFLLYDPFCNTVFCEFDLRCGTVVDTQFHKFYGRPFARVPYLFLMKDIGR